MRYGALDTRRRAPAPYPYPYLHPELLHLALTATLTPTPTPTLSPNQVRLGEPALLHATCRGGAPS